MATTSGGLVKRSTSYDPDVLDRLRERGKRLDRTIDWQVREILRVFLDAEQQAAPAEAGAR